MSGIQSFKSLFAWPYLVTVPLLLAALGLSVFFTGTESPLFAPAFVCMSVYALIVLLPGFRDGWHIPKTNTFFFVLFYWIYFVIAQFWSASPFVSTLFTCIFSILPALFIVTVLAANPLRQATVNLVAFGAVITGFAVWALVQFLFLYDQYGPRISHPMLSPNNLAGLFNLALFPAIGIYVFAKGWRTQIASLLLVILLYFALVVTQSRGGFFSAMMAVMVFIPVMVTCGKNSMSWRKVAVLAAVAVGVLVLGNMLHSGALERNLVGEQLVNPASMEHRFLLWKSTWEMIKDHFWAGAGLATFYFFYPRYRYPGDGSDGYFAHIDPLQFWAEAGIMAPVLFYGVLICVLLRTARAIGAAGDNQAARLKVIAPFCGMLALTIHTHIDFHLYMPAILIPLAALLAYWYVVSESVFKAAHAAPVRIKSDTADNAGERLFFKPDSKASYAVFAALVVVILPANIWMIREGIVVREMAKLDVVVAGNAQAAQDRLTMLAKIAPPSYSRIYESKARYALAEFSQYGANLPNAQKAVLYNFILGNLRHAQRLNPEHMTLYDLEGRLYYSAHGIILPDGRDRAIAMFRAVLAKNPLAVNTRVALSEIYLQQEQVDMAMDILVDGARWPKPKGVPDVNFYLQIAKVAYMKGDTEDAKKWENIAQERARRYNIPLIRQ